MPTVKRSLIPKISKILNPSNTIQKIKNEISNSKESVHEEDDNDTDGEEDIINDILEENDLYKLICTSVLYFCFFFLVFLNLIIFWLSYDSSECPIFVN